MAESKRAVPAEPGGPANINGILLQVLWTLFQAAEIRFLTTSTDANGSLSEATVEVEPSSGGDLVVRRDGRRYVEQLKARSSGNAWSLQDVITKVFPDLYLAIDLEQPKSSYRFVTEAMLADGAMQQSFSPRSPNVIALSTRSLKLWTMLLRCE